jgi:hypothetical protein
MAVRVRQTGPVRHEPARVGISARRKHPRNAMTRRQRIGNDSRQATEVGTSGGVVGRGGHRTRSATPRTIAHHDRSRLEPNGCEDPSSRAGMLCLLVVDPRSSAALAFTSKASTATAPWTTHAVETAPQFGRACPTRVPVGSPRKSAAPVYGTGDRVSSLKIREVRTLTRSLLSRN